MWKPHPDHPDIGAEIANSIGTLDDAKELSIDIADLGLSRILDERILDGVGPIRMFIGVLRTVSNLADRIFAKKVISFLIECNRIPMQERRAFLDKNYGTKEQVKALGDMLVLVLDRLDDFEKPPMVARAFAAQMRGQITFEMFRRLATAIDIGFIEDLKVLAGQSPGAKAVPATVLENLFRTGLVSPSAGIRFAVDFELNDVGKNFVRCMNIS